MIWWWTAYHFYKLNLVFKLCLTYAKRKFKNVLAKSVPNPTSILSCFLVTKLCFCLKAAIHPAKRPPCSIKGQCSWEGSSYDFISGQWWENQVLYGTSGLSALLKRGRVPISIPSLTALCHLECWCDGWSSSNYLGSSSLRMVGQKDRSLGHYGATQPVLDYLPLGCSSAYKWNKLSSWLSCYYLEVCHYVQSNAIQALCS